MITFAITLVRFILAGSVIGSIACDAGRRQRKPDSVLAVMEARTQAAFRSLPDCRAPESASSDALHAWLPVAGAIRLPAEFKPDTIGGAYFEGGALYRYGSRTVEIVGGPVGWSYFTGDYTGKDIPDGCRVTVGPLSYLIVQQRDSSGHHAFGIPITDTVRVSGTRLYRASGPSPQRDFLLQILGTHRSPAS